MASLSGYSQSISITTTNTPSICYNDGTLTINATGGTAPYTDSILSGPTNPNLTYPIALPAGQSIFADLPHGSFTIVVHDAAGHSGTFTASVGGTYEFPSDTLFNPYQNSNIPDTLFCIVSPNTGKPPYSFAISSTGANSGFGLYQSQDFFAGLCPGEYWVRLRDSCGNIFTNNYAVSYIVYCAENCSNIAAGDVSLTASGGNAPYTYNIINATTSTVIATNTTGNFNSLTLPRYTTYSATDACGQTYTSPFGISYAFPTYEADCPFGGSVILEYFNGPVTPPVVVSCLNCLPVQNDTFSYVPNGQSLFTGLVSGNSYIFKMSDACDNINIDTFQIAPSIVPVESHLSCRSINISYQYSSGSAVPGSYIDSTVLLINGQRYTSRTGYFYDLPQNTFNDSLEVFTTIGCNSKMAINLGIPNYSLTFSQYHGPGCEIVWDGVSSGAEQYYFISSANDTTFGQPVAGAPGQIVYRYLQPTASYTIVSDSGCSTPFTTPPIRGTDDSIVSYVNCLGQPVINVVGYDTNYYGGSFDGTFFEFSFGFYVAAFYLHDSLVYTSPSTWYNNGFNSFGNSLTYNPADTGLYTYKIFNNTLDFGYYDSVHVLHAFSINTIYDSICPQDSGTIYVTSSTVPFPYVQTAYKCLGLDTTAPQLIIYGGSIPYTIQIAGLDTFIMNYNTAAFPTDSPGTYNVIAYDNCGISRSFTFSIFDTCACALPAAAVSYTYSGFTYQFHDSITAGNGPFSYTWNFGDGSPVSNLPNPAHTYPESTATYGVTLIITGQCGSDTITQTVNTLTGLSNASLSERINIYPNPSTGSFTIAVEGNSSSTLTAEISDMPGRIITRQPIHSGTNLFDLALAPGVYAIRISDGISATVRMISVK